MIFRVQLAKTRARTQGARLDAAVAANAFDRDPAFPTWRPLESETAITIDRL
jgi:hypothetical protein